MLLEIFISYLTNLTGAEKIQIRFGTASLAGTLELEVTAPRLAAMYRGV